MTNARTTLYQIQSDNGAKMIDFHGWDMPVQFTGIIPEHQAVRSACGVFDLGHMGRLRLTGPAALDFLNHEVCRPLASMEDGHVRYGLVCRSDGGADDDVLVSRESADSYHVVVNAGNRERILARWQAALPDGLTLTDCSQDEAMVAVQGPKAAGLLAGLGLDPGNMKYYRFADYDWNGVPVRLSRTGYTGEDGFECFLPANTAPKLWQAVVDAGALPCGLGARDTLRLEAGMPLYGQEIDEAHGPVMAGLNFAVGKKGGYIGADVLLEQLANGTEQVLVGLKLGGKRAGRHGYAVLRSGETVGTVTSGTYSPTIGSAIAMAYVNSADAAVGTELAVDLRGKTSLPATVVALPFYKRA